MIQDTNLLTNSVKKAEKEGIDVRLLYENIRRTPTKKDRKFYPMAKFCRGVKANKIEKRDVEVLLQICKDGKGGKNV